MGAVVDTTVFVDLERESRRQQRTNPAGLIGERLAECLGPDEEAAIAAITASELLRGVHRAGPEHHARREAFVEMVLSVMPVLDFDLLAARAHARLSADLAMTGADVGPHDRLVAATAISIGWRVATANVRHFERIAGLEVIEVR
ncbi:MAG TPA: PIN domain-containing protein [Acidimicrobiales bacterium]|nr:PIN domain-containing protein [Acidimicrobiales bacterium]